MDDQSFDRMVRLLGGAASRRRGILAAAAAALGLNAAASLDSDVFAEDAVEDDVDAEKKKKRKRCKPSLIGKARGKKGRKSRCRKASQCCSKLCVGKKRKKKKKHHHKKDADLTGLLASAYELDEYGFDEEGYADYVEGEDDEDDDEDDDDELQGFTVAGDVEAEHKKKRKRRRRCRCRTAGATCKQDANCCTKNVAKVACVNGVCDGEPGPGPTPDPIPTSEACATGDVCKSSKATCTSYASKDPKGTYCLLADGDACSGNADCIGQSCSDGICTGGGPGPSGCTSNAQCSGSTPVCNAGVCVECAAVSDCPTGTADSCNNNVCTCGSGPVCSSTTTPLCCAGACVGGSWSNQTTFGTFASSGYGLALSQDGLAAFIANEPDVEVWTRPSATSADWTQQTVITGTDLDVNDVSLSLDGLTLLMANGGFDNVLVFTRTTANGTDWTQQTSFGTAEGSGPSEFDSPLGVWLSVDGLTALIADRLNNRVSVWTRTTPTGTDWTNQTTFGTAGSGTGQFGSNNLQGVAMDADGLTMLAADDGNARISVWTRTTPTGTDWTNTTEFGGSSSATPISGALFSWISEDGLTAVVPDRGYDRISIWTRSTSTATDWTQQTTFGTSGSGAGELSSPYGAVMTTDRMTIVVTDSGNSRASVWTRTCSA